MARLKQEDLTALELLIDRAGLCDVLDALADIAREKADHLAGNWQDAGAAGAWTKAARRIDGCAAAVAKIL